MVHYAGYAPRFHPSDFETLTRDGVGADWPISYAELKPHYEELERELPVAGQDWPWGDPHCYPFSPHPIGGAAPDPVDGARRAGDRDARRVRWGSSTARSATGRTASTAASACRGARSTPRPAPTSPTCPTRSRTASRSAPDSMAVRGRDRRGRGRAIGVTLHPRGRRRASACSARARSRCAGYSIETPRLLLQLDVASASRTALGNDDDQVGRYVMVQGATQTAGRFPDELRMYKAPAAGGLLRAVLRDRPRARASRADSRSRPSRRCRSGGPSTCSPTVTGAARCASTCATTTTGRRSACSTSCCPTPRIA